MSPYAGSEVGWFFFNFPSLCFYASWLISGYRHGRMYIGELQRRTAYTSIHILKITQGLETGHGLLLGISGTEIKWHHWLGIKKNVDEPAAIGEHIPRRRKLLIRCSICGLILSPCTLRWRDLHKTWRILPGSSGPRCAEDPVDVYIYNMVMWLPKRFTPL